MRSQQPIASTSKRVLGQVRSRLRLRTRARRALGEAPWEQLARTARASADRSGLEDLDPSVQRIVAETAPYTKTPAVRVAALCASVDYVLRQEIPGSIVECGLWRGGSLMAAALRLIDLGITDRALYGYDTFAGMTRPSEHDFDPHGKPLTEKWRQAGGRPRYQRPENLAPGTSREAVFSLLVRTGYERDAIHLVEGPVEETLPENAPTQVAILRLDTDLYESTRHELIHLYPRLSRGGVLIIDDYAGLAGARKAVDDYFTSTRIFLHRLDHTARIAVKQE